MPFVCATHFLSNEITETIVIHFSCLLWSDKIRVWNFFEMLLIPENTLNLDLTSALRDRVTPNPGKGDPKVQQAKLGMNQRYWVFAQDETKPNQTKATSLTRWLNSTEIQIYVYRRKWEATGSASCTAAPVRALMSSRPCPVLWGLEGACRAWKLERDKYMKEEEPWGPWWRPLSSTGEAYYLQPKKASSR